MFVHGSQMKERRHNPALQWTACSSAFVLGKPGVMSCRSVLRWTASTVVHV